jgi:YD repeat-containing protein
MTVLAAGKAVTFAKGETVMKKAFAVSLALMLCLSAIALAAPDGDKNMQGTVTGTITKVDTAAKTLTIKEASGNETTVYWDEATRVSGDLKEGSMAQVSCSEKDGRKLATSINVKAAKSY